MYQPPDLSRWKGRNDPLEDNDARRWHHVMRALDLSGDVEQTAAGYTCFSLLGFCCDEGVRRNQGRAGAAEGPAAIRKALRNLSFHHDPERVGLYDAGDLICPEGKLEQVQRMLGKKIVQLLAAGHQPIVLGGGHEVAFGHFLGVHEFCGERNRKVGIINLDTHFDLRKYDAKGNSGTSFLQLHEWLMPRGEELTYLVLGIDEASNTRALFTRARELNVAWHLREDFKSGNLGPVFSAIEKFTSGVQAIYLSLDLDVLDQAYAPGVSAPSPFGLQPETVRQVLQKVLRTNKVLSIDVAELNPSFDQDERTARLAARFIYDITDTWVKG
ncbi:MAG TPA: formimidoylglutamase [Cyclobacteriaceae bacterium]